MDPIAATSEGQGSYWICSKCREPSRAKADAEACCKVERYAYQVEGEERPHTDYVEDLQRRIEARGAAGRTYQSLDALREKKNRVNDARRQGRKKSGAKPGRRKITWATRKARIGRVARPHTCDICRGGILAGDRALMSHTGGGGLLYAHLACRAALLEG